MKPSLHSGRARLHFSLLAGGLFLVLLGAASQSARISAQPAAAARGKITFARDIEPIFQKSCNTCHGAMDKPQGGLRLDSEAAALKGGDSGKVIVPGDSEKSDLVKRLVGNGEETRMPMGADPLPANQIKLIRAWIDQIGRASCRERV